MGVSVTALAGLGILVNLDNLPVTVRFEPSCEHAERVGSNFCPVCGKKVQDRRIEEADFDYYDIVDALDSSNGPLPHGYMFYRIGYEEKIYFFGYGLTISEWGDFSSKTSIPPEDEVTEVLETAFKILKEKLKDMPDIKLDFSTYGLHCALPCS